MNGDIDPPGGNRSVPVETGEWKGWFASSGDPFNAHSGPFHYRVREDGSVLCAMRVEPKHLNGGGAMHGGALMTSADYCLYALAAALGDSQAVTVTLNGEFAGAVPLGSLLECTGDVIRSTGSMVFLRGVMTTGGEPVLAFSGVLKKKRRRV